MRLTRAESMITLASTHPTMLMSRSIGTQHGQDHAALRPNLCPRIAHTHARISSLWSDASRIILSHPGLFAVIELGSNR